LKATLQKLSTDEYGLIVRLDQTSGLCSFTDPFYRVFAMAHFRNNGQPQSPRFSGELDLTKFLKMLEDEMSRGTKIIIKASKSE
jgi:hypothetical protein